MVSGDFNLDAHRLEDLSYSRRGLLLSLFDSVSATGLSYHPTPSTWKSYGKFSGAHRFSCIDPVLSAGVQAEVNVLDDMITDHHPVVATMNSSGRTYCSVDLSRRDFKNFPQSELESDLSLYPWEAVYDFDDVNVILNFVVNGIMAALDMVAPSKVI